MNINDLTIGQAKELAAMFGAEGAAPAKTLASRFIGQHVIVRTYSAGVFCGILEEVAGDEVILKDSRRLFRFWCKESISLSGVTRHGINKEKSKICGVEPMKWVQAIEITPISGDALASIISADEAEQE